jgi:hypothetical protein
MPSAGRPRPGGNVGADREALGLSSMKPSEMIAGLDAAVRRAEAQEQRESARRKGGGKIDQNVALHVSDSGARSTRLIVVGIVVFVVLMACLFGALVIYSNYQPLDPHKGNEMARDRLGNLKFLCEKTKKFEDDETITLDKAKARILETIDARLKALNDEIEANRKQWEKDKNTRPVNVRVIEEKKDLEQTREFKDPFGQPFQFQLNGDKLQITAKGKYDSKGGSLPAPITIELKKHKAEDSK